MSLPDHNGEKKSHTHKIEKMARYSIYITIVLLYMFFSSCSKGEKADMPQDDVVSFSMKSADAWDNLAQSKAVVVDNSELCKQGFGVLAYYTKDVNWNAYTGKAVPNFINNSRVTSSDGGLNWTYSPVKYWPHKQGEKISFFAYAPHDASVDINTLKLRHVVNSDVKKQVDMLWSYAATTDKTYMPPMGKIGFVFRHTLSRVGITVKASTDGISPMNKEISIRVKKVVFTSSSDKTGSGTGTFYTQGTLDIGNQGADPQASWSDMSGAQKFTLDYRNFAGGDASGFLLDNTNTDTPKQLNAPDSYLMLLPQDFLSTGFNIYMEYEVELYDKNDHTYLTYTNRGYCTVNVNLQGGKAYSMNLSLGVKSFSLQVGITSWKGGEEGDEIVINGLVDD